MIMSSSLMIKRPADGYLPPGYTPPTTTGNISIADD